MTPIAMVIGYGQSNEKGTGTAPRYTGTLAAVDPNNYVKPSLRYARQSNISGALSTGTPGSYTACSIFDRLADIIAIRTGRDVIIDNRAVGGTGVCAQWAGKSGATLLRPGDVGYDPSSRISAVTTSVAAYAAAGYEVWSLTAGHQADLGAAETTANIITAVGDIVAAVKTAGASKVFVGKTPRYIGGPVESAWDAGGAIHLIASGVIGAGGSGVYAGGDLSALSDLSMYIADGTAGTAADGQAHVHLNHGGVCHAANIWRDALIAGGHI